ncbi:unnamed protein product [Schistocephalus solidus]|uniref:Uncharacterized protein n=1 Tax=Schistocephalus solidus TaxID=70667 RepID=A0A183TAT4_SCHSO|nr:unnamed protein product [Schistocephalus solidus]
MLFGAKGPLELTGEALTVVERSKTSLVDATLLTHPTPDAPLSDASILGEAAVRQNHPVDSTRPFSKKNPVG